MFDTYTTMTLEPKYITIKEKEIKILTCKQMIQRRTIGLTQVKSGNTSEHLIHEIRKIAYFFVSSKKSH